jgi:hypothetical protein
MRKTITRLAEHIIDQAGQIGIYAKALDDDAGDVACCNIVGRSNPWRQPHGEIAAVYDVVCDGKTS